MKPRLRLAALALASFAAFLFAADASAQVYPARVAGSKLTTAPYASTGLFTTEVDGVRYRGSAAVVRDERLLYTCAHILYDDGLWATEGRFARAWHSSKSPVSSQMVAVRGYRYYANYSGGSRSADFALDFAICYRAATTSFGPALPWIADASPVITKSSTPKLILGYPVRIDFNQEPGRYYQHQTGTFTKALTQSRGPYHTASGISTGAGNSGGPVLALHDGTYKFVGVLVSGSRTSMGVHALDSAANKMARNALSELDTPAAKPAVSKTVKNTSTLRLPDASLAYSTRKLKFSSLPDAALLTTFSIRVDTPFVGDLDVYVRSPRGRIRWVRQHAVTNNAGKLSVKNMDLSSTFAGTNPNGTWKVFMRDYYRGDRATFKSASLTVGAH